MGYQVEKGVVGAITTRRARQAAAIMLAAVSVACLGIVVVFALAFRQLVAEDHVSAGMGVALGITIFTIPVIVVIAYARWAKRAWSGDADAVNAGGKLMFVPLLFALFFGLYVAKSSVKHTNPGGGGVPWLGIGEVFLSTLIPAAIGIVLVLLAKRVKESR